MQIVIDISKEKYDEIMSMDWVNCRRFFDEEIRAIHDGKVLPKGHGRLIDADELESCMKIEYCIVRNAKTIIEADVAENDNEDTPMEYFESGGC